MCESRTVPKPISKLKITPRKVKSSISETPITISGLMIGMFDAFCTSMRVLPFRLLIPIAADVPRIVANSEARTAISRVFVRAFMIELLLNSSRYQSKVKPPQAAERLLLNE